MSSDKLREAAKVLRERAEAVMARDHRPERAVDNFVAYYQERRLSSDTLGIDAAYIATMHPGVGLALADWLDHCADFPWVIDATRLARDAERIADLILGGAS